ncbi:MAG: undecaprenyl-phosphate glucose phosphotransferase [Candidatus Omnitrophica bacterium]|nr:undecaprenyl-phosphate glucose phosphotransferase [Candidatus Omnitrophota bacterium]MDD5670863.1 undecaprenyl-phosphate glucose phosphotransferase [Candidatus Omnitrophota bacterium]
MPITPKQKRFMLLTFLCDALAVFLSVCVAYAIRFWIGVIPVHGAPPRFIEYMRALLFALPVYFIFFRAYGLYQMTRHIRRIEEIFMVIKAVSFAIVALMAMTFFYRTFSYSRLFLVKLWVLSIFFVSVSRYLLIQWEYKRKVRQEEIIQVLLIGANRSTRNIVKWAKTNPHYGRFVIGVLASEPELIGKHFEGVTVLGASADCEELIARWKPDEVILVDTAFSRERITDLVAFCEDQLIEFKVGADIYGLMTRNVAVEYISTVPLLGFRRLRLDDLWNRFVKRTFDLIVSFAILGVTMPLWLAIMVLIKINDRGPVFYAQERMGRDQKLFRLLKFRTMKVDAERETGPVWAQKNDSRRTNIGDFLRRFNLDELPQLFNVLKGDMSLVGPRPERPHFVEKFRESIPRYMARHKIKSGITGWAQVNGYRGDTSIQERLKYDLYYMENWSLLFDIEVLIMTLFAFKNAY